MTLFRWSQTAASNGTADATCPFPEGQAPSSLNDGTRGMMAAVAKYRDDIAGAIVTAGTSTAYTVSSYEGFDTLAHLSGQMIAFTPHITNGANGSSLNVDGLGVKPILPAPGVGLPGGVLIQGTPYVVTYNNTDGAFYLQGFYGNPYNIPIAAGFDYWAPTAPNSSFAFPIGQAISRITYASLFSGNPWSIGTTYGAGDGSTTFNLPDKTGRASVMKEAVATRLTAAGFGGNSANLGAVGGLETEALALGHLPTGITSANPAAIAGTFASSISWFVNDSGGLTSSGAAGGSNKQLTSNGTTSAVTGSTNIAIGGAAVTSNNTGSQAAGGAKNVPTVQPTIVCNYIIRII